MKQQLNKIEKRLLLFGATSYEEMRRITSNPEDLKVIEELERLSMDDYFRYMYNEKEVNERLMNSRYQEGINDGTKERNIEIAKAMLQDEVPSDSISKYTNLSINEIELLKTESKN